MKRFLPYLLPVISIVFLISLFLTLDDTSSPTGFVVADGNRYSVNSEVKLEIFEGEKMYGDALMVVSLDDREASMKISDFVVKAGGELKEVYEGEALYVLQISDFDIDNTLEEGEHTLSIKLVYNGNVISSSSSQIIAG